MCPIIWVCFFLAPSPLIKKYQMYFPANTFIDHKSLWVRLLPIIVPQQKGTVCEYHFLNYGWQNLPHIFYPEVSEDGVKSNFNVGDFFLQQEGLILGGKNIIGDQLFLFEKKDDHYYLTHLESF